MMGVFDTVDCTLKCQQCEKEQDVSLQTKAFDCMLFHYEVGDLVHVAPIGDLWICAQWQCDCQKASHTWQDAWIHLHDGLILGVHDEQEYQQRKGKFVGSIEFVTMVQQNMQKLTEYRHLIKMLYWKITNTRKAWERDWDNNVYEDEKELLDSVLEDICEVVKGVNND